MKILHYTLGFPPQRSGGLVEYAESVMIEQSKAGDDVYALSPGLINILNRKTYIKYNNRSELYHSYDLINSLPLALFGGIKSPKDFMKKCSYIPFYDFLKMIKPDVIHVHTLMGLPIEFLTVAKRMHIKLVFTSHDYYGLAPEPTFFFDGHSYDTTNTVDDWIFASCRAMPTWKLRIFQLHCYPIVRNLSHKFSKKVTNIKKEQVDSGVLYQDYFIYKKLKNYYLKELSLIDKFHFNSNLSKRIYKKYVKKASEGKVISITDLSTKQMNTEDKKASKKIRIGYIGPNRDYKGFNDFKIVSEKLNNSRFEFHTYGYVPKREEKNIIQHGRYSKSNIEDIYRNIDVLVVPSKWMETFGLVVLESLAFNTPVFVSKNVGAKDLVSKEYIFNSIDDLCYKLTNFKKKNFKFHNMKTIEEHVKELNIFYSDSK